MPESLNYTNSRCANGRFDDPVIPFIPAQLKEYSSGWVIEYFVVNPETMAYDRFREKFQRMRKKFPSDDEARKAAKRLCKERNKQLSSGWSPFMKEGSSRIFTRLDTALDLFLKEKLREIRPDTRRVYKSQVSMFMTWLNANNLDGVYVKHFSSINADDYLTHQFVELGKSSCTYNNYLTFFRGLFNWFIDKGYCDHNPFSKLKRKKEEEKKRDVIPPEWDFQIMDYCRKNDPSLALICMLVYSSFIRPAEICRIKIKDIHLDKSAIYIPGENAKNTHARWATLTPDTCQMITDLGILDFDPDWYMVSTFLRPGTKKKETRDIDKHWTKMRKIISLPSNYQLYSYRDTGIMWLKESGVPDYLIVKLTGHIKTDMLQKYTHAPQEEALRLSSQFLPKLGERGAINHGEKSAYATVYGNLDKDSLRR